MVWLYRRLIHLLPPTLRREYGAAIEETFARRWDDAQIAGFWTSVHVCWREFAGLTRWLASIRLARPRQE